MAQPVLIIGRSGTGKSTSMRNFKSDELALINVEGKPLPFRGKFDSTMKTDNYATITKGIDQTKKKVIVIDDAGYLLTNQFMKGHSSSGAGNAIFSFYNDLADKFWALIHHIKDEVPEDKIVYLMMHEDADDLGKVKPKTIGKMLDEKVCVEGMFTIVLRSIYEDGKYLFRTQTDGNDVVKTPIDMFSEKEIDNDLKVVDQTIREYYNLNKGKE